MNIIKNQGEEERMITLLQKLEDKGKIYDEETISKVAPAFSFINFKKYIKLRNNIPFFVHNTFR